MKNIVGEQFAEVTVRTSHIPRQLTPINCDFCITLLAALPNCSSAPRLKIACDTMFGQRAATPSYLDTHKQLYQVDCPRPSCNKFNCNNSHSDNNEDNDSNSENLINNENNDNDVNIENNDIIENNENNIIENYQDKNIIKNFEVNSNNVNNNNNENCENPAHSAPCCSNVCGCTCSRCRSNINNLYSESLATVEGRVRKNPLSVYKPPILSSYSGHVPLEYKYISKGFPMTAIMGIAEFEEILGGTQEERQECSGGVDTTQNGHCQSASNGQTGVYNIYGPAKDENHDPYKMCNDDPLKYYIPGYSGHVPMTLNRNDAFSTMTRKGLNQFTDTMNQLHGHK